MDRGSHVPNLRIIRKIYNHSRSSALDLAHVKCKLKQTLNTASLMLGLLRHFFILNFKNPWSGSVWKFRSLGFCEYRNNQGCGKCFPFLFSEMPTSGYLKSGDSLFCTTAPIPPPPQMSTALQNPPAHKLTQLPWLRTLYEVLHEVQAIKICFHLCQWLKTCKNVPETVQWIKKVWILREEMG